MAERRILGSSNMAVLLQNEGIFPQNFESLTRPARSSAGFLGSQSVMNFSKGYFARIKQPPFWPIELDESANTDMDHCIDHPEKKKRLTEDQVQFLEKSFKHENKLEPERKIQLAKDLGLHPRQVAIWFQNRRARWKTRQLENDYEVLRRSYDILKNDYDNTLKEKEELQAKVISLTNILLLNEKKDEKLGLLDCSKVVDKFTELESNIEAEVKQVEKFTTVCKQEDIGSANSIVLDSESPHYIDGGYSMMVELTSCSTAFGHDQSEQSQVGEVDMAKGCDHFFPLQDNSANYESEVDDQALWIW